MTYVCENEDCNEYGNSLKKKKLDEKNINNSFSDGYLEEFSIFECPKCGFQKTVMITKKYNLFASIFSDGERRQKLLSNDYKEGLLWCLIPVISKDVLYHTYFRCSEFAEITVYTRDMSNVVMKPFYHPFVGPLEGLVNHIIDAMPTGFFAQEGKKFLNNIKKPDMCIGFYDETSQILLGSFDDIVNNNTYSGKEVVDYIDNLFDIDAISYLEKLFLKFSLSNDSAVNMFI